MQITSKGQVTIPLFIRKAMGFLPHTKVAFILKKGCVYLEKEDSPQKSNRGRSIISSMRGKGDIKMTTDEIMALTRKISR